MFNSNFLWLTQFDRPTLHKHLVHYLDQSAKFIDYKFAKTLSCRNCVLTFTSSFQFYHFHARTCCPKRTIKVSIIRMYTLHFMGTNFILLETKDKQTCICVLLICSNWWNFGNKNSKHFARKSSRRTRKFDEVVAEFIGLTLLFTNDTCEELIYKSVWVTKRSESNMVCTPIVSRIKWYAYLQRSPRQ